MDHHSRKCSHNPIRRTQSPLLRVYTPPESSCCRPFAPFRFPIRTPRAFCAPRPSSGRICSLLYPRPHERFLALLVQSHASCLSVRIGWAYLCAAFSTSLSCVVSSQIMQHIDRTFQELLRKDERIHIVPRNMEHFFKHRCRGSSFKVDRPSDVPRVTRLLADAIRITSNTRPRDHVHVTMPYFVKEERGYHLLCITYKFVAAPSRAKV